MTKSKSHLSRRILPALLAGGACGLAGQHAHAVQLGELEVQSGLGQPLRASIAYALSANEQIHDYCIFLNSSAGTGVPALTRAQLTLSAGRINIASNQPLREPMVTIGLTVNCPYSANLTRSYTLLLDPVPKFLPPPANEQIPAAQEPTRRAAPPVTRPTVSPRRTASPVAARQPQASIPITGSYQVNVGDTLSDIASRIESRPVGLWQAVNAIFAANPEAFIDGDLNRLKAGSVLVLPAFDGTAVTTVRVRPVDVEVVPEENIDSRTPGNEAAVTPAAEAPFEASTVTTEIADGEAVTAFPTVSPTIEMEQPVAASDASESISTEESNSDPIPTTSVTADSNPATAPIDTRSTTSFVASDDGSSQLLYWLGGAGLALFLGLVAFRSRSRLTSPSAPASQPLAADEGKVSTKTDDDAVSGHAQNHDIDFDIGVEAESQRQVVLDADLSAGTGLNDATDVEVAQNFGFSTTMDLDAGDNAELASGATITGQRPAADALPRPRFVEESILEKEVLPSDDEYDLSMIVDATQKPIAEEDVTAKDLVAIAVASESSSTSEDDTGNGDYTLNEPVDFETLEQDYEDELTATQALNAEIAAAAVGLSGDLSAYDEADTAKIVAIDASNSATGSHKRIVVEDDDDETAILTDLDDTGVNEALLPDHSDLTAEIPHRQETDTQEIDWSFEGTVEMPAASDESRDRLAETSANTQLTEELPTAENDPTLEMDVESGHFRTKKLRG